LGDRLFGGIDDKTANALRAALVVAISATIPFSFLATPIALLAIPNLPTAIMNGVGYIGNGIVSGVKAVGRVLGFGKKKSGDVVAPTVGVPEAAPTVDSPKVGVPEAAPTVDSPTVPAPAVDSPTVPAPAAAPKVKRPTVKRTMQQRFGHKKNVMRKRKLSSKAVKFADKEEQQQKQSRAVRVE
jgi:hypothetical protein